MKTQEEIEQLATKHYKSNGSGGGQYTEGLQEGRLIGYVDGYTQCQEDMADRKYTEEDLHTILRLRKKWYSHTDKNVVRDFIKSQNKQD